MNELYENGIISKKVFTLFLGSNTTERVEQSKIWIGESIIPEEAVI